MKQFDILVPGHYFCDIIFSGLPQFPAPGIEVYTQNLTVVPGGVMNTVIGMHRLGVKVGWLGAAGSDFFSRYALEQAFQEGLDTSLLVQHETRMQRVTVSLSQPHDRAFVSYVDAAPDTTGMLLDAWDSLTCKHLHFTGLTVDERLIDLLHNCRDRGIFVSMDCQYNNDTLDMPLVQQILSLVDMFMPNASEAIRLTRADHLSAASQALLMYVPALVVKDGAGGAHAWWDGCYYYVPALAGIQVVDTTGAGDVFNAGFLSAHVSGEDTAACLCRGNIAGGLSTQGYGGCSTAPTLAQVEQHRRSASALSIRFAAEP